MWRRLIALTHPDRAGDEELFIWTRTLHEHVVGDDLEDVRTSTERRQPPPHRTTGERIDYTEAFDRYGSFEEATERIVALADSGQLPEQYAALLRLLSDCYPAFDGPLYRMQHEVATYRSGAAAYAAGMSRDQRVRWYRICESAPLSQRHIGHILSKLKREAA